MSRTNKRSTTKKRRQLKNPIRNASPLRIAGIAVLGMMILAGAGLLWLWPRCSGEGCPSVASLREYTPPQASRVFDRSGQLIAHLAPERRIVVPLEQIPAGVVGAFLAVEDRRFFEHEGVDWRRAAGALVHDIRTLSFDEGFSTITMQLARNVFPEHLTREKTLRRKLWEVMLAWKIEDEFSKDEILELYLNQIYLGEGLYGVEAAARGYYGKSARELDTAEAAMLAALPKAPSTYNPRENPVAAVRRRNLVLDLMAQAGVISAAEAESASAEPLDLAPPIEAKGDAPYFVAAVRDELRERFGPGAANAGLRVYTTVDLSLQVEARDALQEQIRAIEADELGNFQGPVCSDGEIEDPRDCLQGLFVAIEVQSGDILAMVGGRDFAVSQFNRVTQARRQPGSAFKPIVYASALEAGIPITTPLIGPGATDFLGTYRPADHVADSVTVNMREGLRVSSNRAAVALGNRTGVQNVIQTAKSLGLSTEIPPYPSTFLGAAEVVPLQLVAAYSAFANNGFVVTPRLIRRVENASGEVLLDVPVRREQAISPEAAFLTTSLMQDVINSGTGHRARAAGLPYSVPAAGKTGTTDDAADAWFVGVTPDLAAGVWIGFDQRKRIMPGAEGGTLAAPVWGEVLGSYYESHPTPPSWIAPFNLVTARVDSKTGLLATDECPPEQVVEEWFIPGTVPTEYCDLHPDSGVGGWLTRQLRDLGDWLGGGDDADAPPGTTAAPDTAGAH
ncbi:MAG TPA: PBP1A family penicillin-binding protein [Longimicrobiaceae bacterium]|nr:PBP1A family penicillin-binding protein [Longimicrobiaceae bacterium]